MPEVQEVRVAFKKMVSDGNYGHEVFEVGFTATLEQPENHQEVAFNLAYQARAEVLAHLSQSTNETIREALETREEREARWNRESDERRREADERRAAAEGGQDARPS